LPFHELVESALRVVAQLLVGTLFGYPAFGINTNDAIRSFDSG
jgi:hypothetical protein